MLRIFAILILSFSAKPALAQYSLICGQVRDQGPEKAELALVQDLETLDYVFYVDGKALKRSEYEVHGAPENRWYVSVFDGNGELAAHYEFSEKPAGAQQFKPGVKHIKVGEPLKCTLTDTDD